MKKRELLNGRSKKVFPAVLASAALGLAFVGVTNIQPASAAQSITVWHYFNAPAQVKEMTDYGTLFQKDHPGVVVKNVYIPYDQEEPKLIAAAGAKTGPDVVVFNGGDADLLIQSNVIAPMTKHWNSFADKSKFPAGVIHSYNGGIYAVQGYVNLLGLWYNADLLKQDKLTPPKTFAELTADLAAVKAAGQQGITLTGMANGQGEWQALPWLTNFGFNYATPTAATATSAFSMIKDWVDKGYLSQQSSTWDQTVPFTTWAAGGVAFAENGNWQMGTAASTAKFKYGVVPMPLSATGKVYLGGEAEGIGAFSKNPTLAWQYLQSTYFSKAGQTLALKEVGSIPSRSDLSDSPSVTGNPLLSPFVYEIQKMGQAYPPASMPGKNVSAIQTAGGQAWSAVIGGQATPETAAKSFIDVLTPLLTK